VGNEADSISLLSLLLRVENDQAGMVWAPSAIYDSQLKEYFVFWSSRFYNSKDSNHSEPPVSSYIIRYCTTKDFVNFSTPKDFINKPGEKLIDQEFQYLGQPGHFARFIKSEGELNIVYQENTKDGIMSKDWVRVGGPQGVVTRDIREGPASFQDNLDPHLYHLWLDNYSGMGGYEPYESRNIEEGSYTKSVAPNFPRGIRHGSVTPVNNTSYK
jgi:hypothetical protein